jgi:hypothetical protein
MYGLLVCRKVSRWVAVVAGLFALEGRSLARTPASSWRPPAALSDGRREEQAGDHAPRATAASAAAKPLPAISIRLPLVCHISRHPLDGRPPRQQACPLLMAQVSERPSVRSRRDGRI